MGLSKEYVIAKNIFELLKTDDISIAFDLFDKLYSVIAENDLVGIEIYLALEELLDTGKVYTGQEIIILLDRMFLKFSWHDIDRLCKNLHMTRYDCWCRFAQVVYCIQPLFFHFVNEKEFFGEWCHVNKEWLKEF